MLPRSFADRSAHHKLEYLILREARLYRRCDIIGADAVCTLGVTRRARLQVTSPRSSKAARRTGEA